VSREPSRWEIAAAADPATLCQHCNQPKSEHGKMGFRCPWSKHFKKTTTFAPAIAS
jgi:tRNA(Ile2) C34 agmatinyltransferase TiaS